MLIPKANTKTALGLSSISISMLILLEIRVLDIGDLFKWERGDRINTKESKTKKTKKPPPKKKHNNTTTNRKNTIFLDVSGSCTREHHLADVRKIGRYGCYLCFWCSRVSHFWAPQPQNDESLTFLDSTTPFRESRATLGTLRGLSIPNKIPRTLRAGASGHVGITERVIASTQNSEDAPRGSTRARRYHREG